MQVRCKNGQLWEIPGEHFMGRSVNFCPEQVIYEIDEDLTQNDMDWLTLFSKDDELLPIVKKLEDHCARIEKTKKTFFLLLPALVDSCLDRELKELLERIQKMGAPKNIVVELAKYFYARASFPNSSYIWKKRAATDFYAMKAYYEHIKKGRPNSKIYS